METIGVKHKASIYLKHFDTYIGGLGVMRSDKEGPFTDDDIHARSAAQNIDRRAVVKKVLHHLPGHGLGKGRNPLICHAVVARNRQHESSLR